MITKTDLLLLLTDMQKNGTDVSEDISMLYSSKSIPLPVLKKINDYRELDLVSFYEKLRTSYNNKKSKLYINIMRANENTLTDPETIVTTLSALLNQILQFRCDDKDMFYKHARADEIIKVLNIYINSGSYEPAQKLLNLFKIDIKCLDTIR